MGPCFRRQKVQRLDAVCPLTRLGEMHRALRDMPQHYREAVILVGVIGESYLDTAMLLHCDVGTVKSRVSRARTMLRDALQPAL